MPVWMYFVSYEWVMGRALFTEFSIKVAISVECCQLLWNAIFGSSKTILLCIVGDLEEGGSEAVDVGVSDM